MSGLYVSSIITLGSLSILVAWFSRRYHVPPSRQLEIAFYFGGSVLWIGTLIGVCSPVQVRARFMAQQNTKLPLPTTPQTAEPQLSGPVVAYAVPKSGMPGAGQNLASGLLHGYDRWTAVYDIAAHTVYLPSGATLEAHSGRRDRLDDPRYVHERMRGATPPNVYELELRERLFHGVQALRLKPVGGGNLFGRTGFLAHTYMLGPRGDSNGCVVFKHYDAFLQAFQTGEVKRLIVVTHTY
jgi:hypothetical protein